MTRLFRLFALALFAFVVVACQHPRWTVVRQAKPVPFDTDSTFAVEPLRFEGMSVAGQTEEAFLTSAKPEIRDLWAENKETMSKTYDERVAADPLIRATTGAPDGKAFIVRATVTWLDPGTTAGSVAIDGTDVRLTVQILDPEGKTVLDEVQLRATIPAGVTNTSTGGRMRSAANELGSQTAQYLDARIRG